MKIVTLVKSTLISHQSIPDKYFLKPLHASFHIESLSSKFQFKFEPYTALHDGENYFHIEKATEYVTESVKKLARDSMHQVYVGIYQFGALSHYIATELSTNFIMKHQRTLYVDNDGEFHWVGEKIPVEKPSKEYEDIQPTIDKALAIATVRQAIDHQHRLTLFAQHQEDLKHRREELERAKAAVKQTQAELAVEAAQLAGDAMTI